MSIQETYNRMVAAYERDNILAEEQMRNSRPDREPESTEERKRRSIRRAQLELLIASAPDVAYIGPVVRQFYERLNSFPSVEQFLPTTDESGDTQERVFTNVVIRKLSARRLAYVGIILAAYPVERDGIEFRFTWSSAHKGFIPYMVDPDAITH